jgi:outer membrane receptor protein involved in Fe transport
MHRLFSFFVSTLVPASALAASLTVRVLDPQDAAVPRAAIQLNRQDASFATAVVADGNGTHTFEALAPGRYLVSVAAPGFAGSVVSVELADSLALDVRLEIAAVQESVVVTSSKNAERLSEVTKTVSVVDARELELRDEYFLPEALRTLPGVRVEQQGGPGAFTSIKIRGLRTEDTAVLVDGARLRDPSSTQGDASSFFENLVATDVDRVEVLRGAGSSLYGTNAGGGVVHLVSAPGGGDPRGSLLFEGGGLGFFRGRAQASGGVKDRLLYSVGVSQLSVTSGVDGDDDARNTSVQGRALFKLDDLSSLSFRFYGADARLALNESPMVLGTVQAGEVPAIALSDSELRRYEEGTPVSDLDAGDATYIPSADDPDNRRESSFYSTLLAFEQKPRADFSYRLSYHGLIGSRSFYDGPLGASPFEPMGDTLSRFDGDVHTMSAVTDYSWGKHQLIQGGYEYERESFSNENVPSDPSEASSTDVSQSSSTLYLQDQLTLLDGTLSLTGSVRAQFFSLDEPRFTPEEGAPYDGAAFDSPDPALTGDVSAAYLFVSSGTRLRGHYGNGYRAPSLYERFGASFSSFGYFVFGDPRLAPERTRTFDVGVEQTLFGSRLRTTATYFRTRLSEIIVFDFSGAIDPETDPFGRFGGYLSTDGGTTQGIELSLGIAPARGSDIQLSYTYTDAEPPRGVTEEQSQAFAIPRHQLSMVLSQRFSERFTLAFDLYASSSYVAPIFDSTTFASRIYRFDPFVKADLVASYRIPAGSASLRFFGKVENVFDEVIYASGFRTPGRFALFGIGLEL